MDMEQDAVQVRPLRQITGEAEFNELFIEEARIPNDNIVGGEGNGWAVAITTLMHERATLAFGLQIAVKRALAELIEQAKESGAAADPQVRDRLAQLVHRGRGAAPERLPRAQRDHARRRARDPRARWASGSGPRSTRR